VRNGKKLIPGDNIFDQTITLLLAGEVRYSKNS
jgi:hypothetical protein